MKPTHIGSALALVLAASTLPLAHAGDACFTSGESNNFASQLGDRTSWGIATQQARNPWDDWIWRGPEFYCNSAGKDCVYNWTQSNSKAYQWSAGVDMKLDNLPIIGSALNMFNVKGQYQYTSTYMESFGWSQTISPGQRAQPVQVVVRRWKSGYFQGGWWKVDNGSCHKASPIAGNGAIRGNRYWWDGKMRYGSWSANVEERRFAMYHIWR
jgi:hypothetical protein